MSDDNQSYFDAVFNHSFHFAAITDIRGIVSTTNSLCKKICGDAADEAIGAPLWEAGWWAAFPEAREQTRQALEKVRQGEVIEDEVPFLDREGATRVGTRIFSPVKNQAGDISQIFVAGLDITDKRRKEKALAQSEAKYKKLVDNIPGTVFRFILTPEGESRFDFIGENSLPLFGYDARDVIEDPELAFRQIPRPDLEKVRQAIRFSAKMLSPYRIEHRVRKKDGTTLWVHTSSVPHRRENGDTVWDGIIVNITSQKEDKAMLATTEQFTQTILESSPILFVIHRDGIIKYINRPGCNILGGSSKEEFLGRHIEEFVLPRYRGKIFTRIERLNAGFTNPPEDIGILRKNGQVIYVENTSLPICYKNKNAALLMSIDVTERKLSTQALRESEAKYRSMMEAMDEAAYICSPDFKIEYMNPAMTQKIGWDATRETCHMAIHDRPEQCPWCQHARVMNGETIKTELLVDKSGETFFISHAPIYHTDGSVSKLSIYRDVTEIKQLEARLQQSQKMESIGTLAGGIAHDFNNILFPIMGLAEILIEDLPPGSQEVQSAREIFNAGKRGRDLVDQILSFSRQSDRRLMPLQVQRVIREALKLIRATIPSDIQIQQSISQECGTIMAEPTQLHQIIMNLLTNAWHAMEGTSGQIRITLSETIEAPFSASRHSPASLYARLVVEDSGIGIPPDLINKIFDPYFTTKGNGKGTGLGLATVYGIVKEFNGEIRVTSQPGKGTAFTLYFPILERSLDEGDTQAQPPVPGGHEHILVVDDEEPVVMLEKTMLRRAGYRVTCRTGSVDALERFRADPESIDLVLTDMAMPSLTGDRLAKEILKLAPGTPIIICTGFSERINQRKAEEAGIKGFLKKPIVKSELLGMIRDLLDKES